MRSFFDPNKLEQLRQQVIAEAEGVVVIYGPGAALVHPGDLLVYADMPRWEIQQRMRHKRLGNWGADNQDEDILRRYKRAFFIEWRVFDRHKVPLLKRADFLLDTTVKESPALVSGEALRAGAAADHRSTVPRRPLLRSRRLGRPVDEATIRSRSYGRQLRVVF
nr:Uncharacterised protein [Raoultella sp. NCTC 9187]